MANPYSEDLRNRVISCVEEGTTHEKIAIIFKISPKTVYRWHKQYLEYGHIKAKKRPGKKPRISLEEFEGYVKNNREKTLKQIGDTME